MSRAFGYKGPFSFPMAENRPQEKYILPGRQLVRHKV
nr:MAG TPA: hypothetical protein [Caudoviricetes sp.]DAX71034.1 MAG TPA: hypothetical protein [Caudoviricetes sp.]